MKKILLLLITIFLLTGCNATYEISINENSIYDSIKIYTDNKVVEKTTQDDLDNFLLRLGEWERGYDHYKRELYSTDEITGYHYTYDFKYSEYDATSQLRKCYENFDFLNEDTISIKTSNEFLCATYYPEMENIEISITSEYKILSSNADTQDNNTHTWIINSKNYKQKPIEIKIDKSQKPEPTENKVEIDLQMILVFIIFILLIIVLIIRKRDLKKQS